MITDATIHTAYLVGHLATAVVTAAIGYVVYKRTRMPARDWLAVYLFGIAILSGVAGARILVADARYQLTVLIVYSLLGLVTTLILVGFATAYVGRNPRTDRLFQAFALALIPLLLLVVTSPFHEYHFGAITIHEVPFPHYETAGAIGRTAAIVYALGAYLVFIYYFLLLYLKTRYRPSVAILVFALGFACSFSIVFVSELGYVPVDTYDHMPFGIAIQAVAIAAAAMVLGLQDISPIARDELVEDLKDPFFTLDREHRLLDYNAASERLIGELDDHRGPETLRAEHVGEPLSAVFPQLDESLSDGRPQSRMTVPVEGEPRHYSLSVSQVTDWRDVRGYSVVLRDVTELVLTQERVERQNDQLDQFVSVVSHDLRNPLMAARGYLELAQETGDPDHFATVGRAHERMERMITELLEMARAEDTVRDLQPVSLATYAEQSWELMQSAEATLDIDVAGDLRINANPELLRRILENLFANAITHNDPPVAVRVGPLGDGRVTGFFIEDDGGGLPTDDPNDLFERGYTTTRTGTGFGLAIVKDVVDAHGWEIIATDDTVDGGIRFEITGVEVVETST